MNMKKQIAIVFVSLVSLIYCQASLGWADNDSSRESGFFGSIGLGGGVISGKPSQLDAYDDRDHKSLKTLYEKSEKMTESIPYLSVLLGYHFTESDTDISLSMTDKTDGAFALTLRKAINGLCYLTLSGDYVRNDVWEDPYLVDQGESVRSITNEIQVGGSVGLEELFGTGAMIALSYHDVKVDKDAIAKRDATLARKGAVYAAEISFVIPLSEHHILTPTLALKIGDLEGEANSYTSYGGLLSYGFIFQPLAFETSVMVQKTTYDARHSVFAKTREELSGSIEQTVSYQPLFGFSGLALNALLRYSVADANIDFFESEALIAGMYVSYNF
jgi:hypothetical protein